MVGGVVIEVCQVPGLPEEIYINCVESLRGNLSRQCGIYVPRTFLSERVEIGDRIWWQAGYAMWTPAAVNVNRDGLKAGYDYDIRIPKLGSSFGKDPAWRQQVAKLSQRNTKHGET